MFQHTFHQDAALNPSSFKELSNLVHETFDTIQLEGLENRPIKLTARSGEEHLTHKREDEQEIRELQHIRELGGNVLLTLELQYLDTVTAVLEDDQDEFVLHLNRSKTNNYFALLHTDETGFRSWILPEGEDNRENSHLQFEIPVEWEAEEDEENSDTETLRLVGWGAGIGVGSVGDLLGVKGYSFCHFEWNESRTAYKVKDFPELRKNRGRDFRNKWLELELDKGPTLLLLHGLNGRADKSFDRLLRAPLIMKELHARYGNRIIGFNHPSFSKGPDENARRLLTELTSKLDDASGDWAFPYIGKEVKLEILTRSRGALVARYLIERGAPDLPIPFSVQKVVFLAGPLQGSPSAKASRQWKSFLVNRLLTQCKKELIQMDRDFEQQLDQLMEEDDMEWDQAIVTGAKQNMLGAVSRTMFRCKGLIAQTPEGNFITDLNSNFTPPQTAYYAIGREYRAADFPLSRKKRKRLKKLVSKIFGEDMPHDCVNPFKGATGESTHEELAEMHPEFGLKDSYVHKADESTPVDRFIQHETLLYSPTIRFYVQKFLAEEIESPNNPDEPDNVVS